MTVELDRAVAQTVSRRPLRPVHVGFVADRVTLAKVFLQALRFPPVRISAPYPFTYHQHHMGLILETDGR